jgi:hypothetical protein
MDAGMDCVVSGVLGYGIVGSAFPRRVCRSSLSLSISFCNSPVVLGGLCVLSYGGQMTAPYWETSV